MSVDWVLASEGDLLAIDKISYIHYGVYMGQNLVFNCTPERGEHLCSLSEFSAGRPVSVTKAPNHLKQAAVGNVLSLLAGPQPYNLLSNNCEHSVCKAYGLKPTSGQLNLWLSLLAMGVILVLWSKSAR